MPTKRPTTTTRPATTKRPTTTKAPKPKSPTKPAPTLAKPAKTTTLPGELTIDPTLLDVTVAEINAKYRAGALDTMREIGTLIVGRFFDSSTAAFRSRGKHHASFRALAERADLEVSASTLWTSVKVVEHFELLGPDLASAISVSRHKALALAPSNEVKLELARQVADHEIATVQALAQAVRTAVPPLPPGHKKPGRPRVATVVKTSRRLDTLLTTLASTSDEEFAGLSETERQQVAAYASDAAAAFQAWAARVRMVLVGE